MWRLYSKYLVLVDSSWLWFVMDWNEMDKINAENASFLLSCTLELLCLSPWCGKLIYLLFILSIVVTVPKWVIYVACVLFVLAFASILLQNRNGLFIVFNVSICSFWWTVDNKLQYTSRIFQRWKLGQSMSKSLNHDSMSKVKCHHSVPYICILCSSAETSCDKRKRNWL